MHKLIRKGFNGFLLPPGSGNPSPITNVGDPRYYSAHNYYGKGDYGESLYNNAPWLQSESPIHSFINKSILSNAHDSYSKVPNINGGNVKRTPNENAVIAGSILDPLSGIGTAIRGEQSDVSNTTRGVYDSTADALMMTVPIAGAIMKGLGFAGDIMSAAGMKTDQMTLQDQILGGLPVIGNLASIGAKNTDSLELNNDAFSTVGNSYQGTYEEVSDASEKADKSYSIFSKKAMNKANSAIDTAKARQNQVANIASNTRKTRELQAGMAGVNNNKAKLRLQGGAGNFMRIGKDGLILEKQYLKKGGKMNVIPEGSLHARLHHMDVEGITKKGIPVVSIEEGGELVQQAEIERDEIIFTKEVTDKLEKLYEEGTDEAAIKAGKILVEEILYNTEDKTGLIAKHQQGGILESGNKENFVKPTYKDWYNSIQENARADNYDYEGAWESHPLDELLNHAKDPSRYHLRSVGKENKEGLIPFLKLGKLKDNPELRGEFEWYYSEDPEAVAFRNNYNVIYRNGRYFYKNKYIERT